MIAPDKDAEVDFETKLAEATVRLNRHFAKLATKEQDPLLKLYRLALEIAPELAVNPLYLLWDAPELGSPKGVAAYAQSRATPATRDHLKQNGDWRGPGPVIVIVRDDLSEAALLAVFIHELAHLLPAVPIDEPNETPEAEAADRAAFTEWASDPEPISTCRPQWAIGGHDKDFHLIAMHLWWRAAIRGRFCSPHDVGFGLRYDLSDWSLYWHALAADPVNKQTLTFAQIVAEGPPELFSELWRGDLSQFLKQHPEAEKELANGLD